MIPQDFNLDDFEIVQEPIPENETPRQFMQRLAGYDLEWLENCTWEDIREHPLLQKRMAHVLMMHRKPHITLRPKNANKQE